MRAMNRFASLVGAMAFAVVTTACGNTADGVAKDAENAADATANAAANAGTAVDSAAGNVGDAMHGAKQTADVKAALTADTRIDAGAINVETDGNAKTVTLLGTVRSQEEKTLAEQIAAEKAEGYKIVNNLTIRGS